jgi:arginase family enzyme
LNPVTLLGIPFDANSSYLRGPAKAPRAIRETLHSGASNLCTEEGFDLEEAPGFRDGGDVDLERIEEAAAEVLATGSRLLSLGGDHSITLPLLRAHAKLQPNLTVLQLDAHPDLYDELDGNRFSHACPFARAMEEGLMAQAERFGVEIVEMKDWRPGLDLGLDEPFYLSLDLDVVDPAFAPGVSHHEPGGLSSRELLELIQGLPAAPIGADVVELNPDRDPTGITAALAAKLVKEIAGRMVR